MHGQDELCPRKEPDTGGRTEEPAGGEVDSFSGLF